MIFITIISYLLLFASHTYRPDAGLYHLPFIKILNEEKIIFGLTNLHFRYGHTSIIQYLSAINLNLITNTYGIVIPSALIAVSVILNFLSKIKNQIKYKNYNFHFYYLFGVLIYIFFKMNRYSEYGNDAPAHFLTFYLFSEFIILNNKKVKIDQILNICLLSLFVILNKLTLLPILLIPISLIIKNISFKFIKNFKIYFIFFFAVLWVIKNIFISGCLIYPLAFTCNEKLNWTDLEKIEKISIENEAFSKNWPNYDKKNLLNQSDYIKNFIWFKTWTKKFVDEQKEKSFAYIIFLMILYFIISLKTVKSDKFFEKNLIFLLLLILASILWFIKLPDYRYAYSILISLIIYPFALLLSRRSYKKDPKKFYSSIIFIFFFIFISKNLVRIINTENYFDYPNPRIYSHSNDNRELKYNYELINNIKIYNQKSGNCMYTKPLCTPYEINLKILNKKNYLIFIKKI